jgi:hypothetical protein
MIYYPKTQIRTNLFTNGDEFINSITKELYVGNYYETSLNQQFTGKNPQDPNSVPLIPIDETALNPTQTNAENDLVLDVRFTEPNYAYSIITKQNPNTPQPTYPKFYFAKPTQQDYQNTQFNRFFYKTLSGEKYVEISQNDYNSLINKEVKFLYQSVLAIVLPWQLTGIQEEVFKINARTTQNVENQYGIKGLGLYLNFDYTKFYKV